MFAERHIDISHDDAFVASDMLKIAIVLAIDHASPFARRLSRPMQVIAGAQLHERLPAAGMPGLDLDPFMDLDPLGKVEPHCDTCRSAPWTDWSLIGRQACDGRIEARPIGAALDDSSHYIGHTREVTDLRMVIRGRILDLPRASALGSGPGCLPDGRGTGFCALRV